MKDMWLKLEVLGVSEVRTEKIMLNHNHWLKKIIKGPDLGCKEDPAAAAGEDRESWSEVFVFTREADAEAEAEAEVEARVEFHFPLHKQSTTQAHAIVMFLPESLFLSALSL